MFRNFLISLCLISVIACGSKPRVDLDEDSLALKPRAQHEVIAKEVANILETYSYKKAPMNDSLSSIIYDNLLKALDPSKAYFTKDDIESFEQYRNHISQDFKKGDLSAPYYLFNMFSDRYIENMEFAISQIDVPHDYSIDEEYVSFNEDAEWMENDDLIKDHWRKRVKYDLLNLKLTTTEEEDEKEADEKHKEILRKRYENLISQMKKTNANDAFQIIMSAFTDAVDPHTTYYNPSFAQRFNESMSNTLEGIGASLMIENEMVTIKEVIAGGPAFKDKSLEINDRIIGVAQGEDGEFEDIIGWRLDAAVAKIKGPKGTVVKLKVLPAGQEVAANPKIVSLTREKIVLEQESAQKEIKTIQDASGNDYRIGVIKLPKFYMDFDAYRKKDPNYKSTSRDVKLILDTLKNEQVDAVVLDLRNNGGGSLHEAIELTSLFIDRGPVVQVRDIANRVQIEQSPTAEVAWEGPLGVITNRFSASASEIFAGAIQDYGRGVIFGSTTFGKGTVQSAVDMSRFISNTSRLMLKAAGEDKDPDTPSGAPEFGQINITMAKFYRVTGSSTQHRGVMPDIEFPTQYSAEEFGESSEPAALPWDKIAATKFNKSGDLSSEIEAMKKLHEERMKNSVAYDYLLDDIKEFNKNNKIIEVYLQESKLKAEREKIQEKNKQRKINLAALKGISPENVDDAKIDFDLVLDETLHLMPLLAK
ncbi:MAG TPA: carboxy terminal-processing peptidase [Candidatus Sphingobacterium stercoripullorum]|uniref:Carboxy terminal-processing peptidase n=1 Tax=Candidatus Sphingobacterium stercoripullorum TaxID=2838759 RepID=A0A9D1W7J5_9SPHI|nr:carboxy terminal-processing peptidase [Candidatus Sphingobacterium stercoripullorum]HLR51155.1 carboxy terminal-processing peptidase [Candidatus Sphingobacterium stercoripullorum]